MYPTLAISQGLYPEHLGSGFIDIYGDELVMVRIKEKKKPKKERDFVIVEGFKLGANGFYGKTNEENSWAYDPLYTMKTTVSGQIGLSMWIERLILASKDCTVIQVNTDGITVRILRSDYDACIKASDELMEEIDMSYEAACYDKMVIRDVNNYSAQYEGGGSIKHKGVFEIDKELHKDPSQRIVAIALEKYFFEGIPVRKTIENHDNIYDFCLRLKVDSRFQTEYQYINTNSEKETINMPKTLRYYISKQGGALYKKTLATGKKNGVNVGYVVTEFNNYSKQEMEDYGIDYSFYISECNKIIDIVDDKQLTLF